MKTASAVAAVVCTLAFSVSAAAEEPAAPPPQPERAAEITPPKKDDGGIAPGYKIEAGVASTHVTYGVPKYATKSSPSTEDFAALTLKHLGPGTLTAGSAMDFALSSAAKPQPKGSPQVVPQAYYITPIGPFTATGGFRLKVQPRAADADAAYEGIFALALPNAYVTPTFEAYPEFVQKRGAYAAIGAEHTFTLGRISIKPRANFGVEGYDLKSERVHGQDVTAGAIGKVAISEGFYTLLKPSYSVLVGPDHYYKDPSIGGRSVALLLFAVGVER